MGKHHENPPEKGQGKDRKFRIRPVLLAILDELSAEWATDPTELTNRAVREFLERAGRWPVKRAGESAA